MGRINHPGASMLGRQSYYTLRENGHLYAEILVDIPAVALGDKLFTYRVPPFLRNETFIGAQVLVPFGRQEAVGGYVLGLKERYSGDFAVKDIQEVVDVDPLFDQSYVDFLHWISEYYCTSLASVIQAAVPADFNPKLKRVVCLKAMTDCTTVPVIEDPDAEILVAALAESREKRLSMRALKQRSRLNQARFFRSLSLLKKENLIEVDSESTARAQPKLVNTVVIAGREGKTKRQKEILNQLRRAGGRSPLPRLLDAAGTTYATINKMADEGMVTVLQEEILRDPLDTVKDESGKPPVNLTDYQEKALEALGFDLKTALEKEPDGTAVKPWLLHGVTGSGKTEVYLRLIQKALDMKRSTLLLVPEISLTPQLAGRLKSRFGGKVAIWHSALSAGERYDTWRRLRSADVQILLGARSAVLTSIPDLGLIILDEEHDSSYKQTSPAPRYHARLLALEKARRQGAMVLLGSATPDVGTYHQAKQDSRLLELPERVFKQKMPEVSIVDMRQEFLSGNRSIFSISLSDEIKNCLSRREQAILLMNRRGYASHVFCRACGHVVKCKQCSVSMVQHRTKPGNPQSHGYLACHHCGFRKPSSTECPECKSPFLREYGLGTQRVEHEIKEKFPDARTLRLDSDVASRKGAYQEVFESFAAGGADILIGTQMVAKGLDIASVTLVGVLSADAAFNLPDYRSYERGFQLLSQVAGRAGRGRRPGRVILQTYNPQMPALKLAKKHDYKLFAADELKARQEHGYPPFTQVIRTVVSGLDALEVERACEELTEQLSRFLEDRIEPGDATVLGPAPCLIERIKGKFRYHLIVKNSAGEEGRKIITRCLRQRQPRPGLSLLVDVDSVDML